MAKVHQYQATLTWAGNKGSGTMDYRSYDRSYIISIANKPDILGSSDSAFLGDKTKHNPEDLLLASLSSCHMLWYLHLCSQQEIIVMEYKDTPIGSMLEKPDGSGHFTEVTLNPVVVITDASQIEKANALHEQANKMCFIANSCNFPIKHQPKCIVERG
ncbi:MULTISPECIES: OsmC family protein [Pedobacter]|uniref:OsmC family protein n=1 Tax=Pedobacter heparinus (strain ATCC 13125 / DSM 2366 / CIP 104194 / JCM 7457 / NBRC 12017 / NCIMB 9290 / NRRL B-14731 / HIM 762-3) TaxID=485917 RepID=C6XZY4_PEDHD|nr:MULTISPECIES: OsmC family protein [Pedobacter]ACU02679.1 OsmC family protein [Pedobacter heparinus DSM 2366]MBB5439830.1 organic hydroperoxide reductase OsmC/OhrA [Pedobacter sp. AK017]